MQVRRGYAILLGALVVTATGCPTTVGGHPQRAKPSDLCGMLPIADVQSTYHGPVEPMVTRRLDDSPYHKAGMASCHYGPKDDLGGVVLSIPIGNPPLDVARLLGGSYRADGADLTVGSDKAFFLHSGSEASIAVNHGGTRFVITWTPLTSAPTDTVTQQQLTGLATTVAANLSTNFTLPQHDIATQCQSVRRAGDVVGGSVVMARGSATKMTLNCDYLGPTGIIRARAVREDDRYVDQRVEVLRMNPRDRIDPPIAGDTELSAISHNTLFIEGYVRHCCSLKFDYRAVNDTTDHSGVFDAAQREFATSFVDAARAWANKS